MRKLLIIALLIVGCDNSTEPEVVEDCKGESGGTAVLDECGVCDGDALSCEQPELFVFNSSMYQAFYFFRTVTIDGEKISPSDWVGAFNGDVCVGVRQWDTSKCGSGICDVPAIGYDANTPELTEGYMQNGDIPTFKIYDASENAYYDAVPSEDIPPWYYFGTNIIESLNAITNP